MRDRNWIAKSILLNTHAIRYLLAMRLSKIKLAGFKSFVDPTSIPLPSSLIGIVGPNGCGKSNVIDAVRWVMGESSAKHLRGDSMADVVFNGSSSRKPVGQAAVELLFDNTEGALGGQWANYNEISIKRVVTREGVSSFYLNNTRCRRRDITDIFLGTGLGPRSYAIIEQGTISRLIEAKPEEMRVFIEEAAGVSKYKERRRETENRIRHTRENLDRLNDLREEVEKQIAHLKRQAKTAERYKVLKEEERLTHGQLLALRWQAMNVQATETETLIREHETALEAATAKQRGIEAEIEKHRDQHVEATDAFNEVQSRFYEVGADIARLEQTLQHARERRQQQQNDLEQLNRDAQEVEQQLEFDRNKIGEIEASLQEVEPQLQAAEAAKAETGAQLEAAEQAMHEWQAGWDQFNQQAGEPAQRAEVERTRIEHLEQHLAQLQQRVQRLTTELESHSAEELEVRIQQLETEVNGSGAAVQENQQKLTELQDELQQLRHAQQELHAQLNTGRDALHSLQSRRASLEALQQAALGKQDGAVIDWLRGRELDTTPRLAEQLDVEHGWERAAECVLGSNLEAVCVDGVDPFTGFLDGLQGGSLTLLETAGNITASSAHNHPRLLDKVRADWSLESVLGGVYISEDLADALALRTQLGVHESVVTRDGIWLGKGWLRVVRDRDEKAGVLEREHELKQLAGEISQASDTLNYTQNNLDQTQSRTHQLESEREQIQTALNEANRQHTQLQSQLSAQQAALEQVRANVGKLTEERADIRQQMETSESELSEARGRLEQALDEVAGFERQREGLASERDTLRASLDDVRAAANRDRDAAHQHTLRAETLRTEQNSYSQALQRMEAQSTQLTNRRSELEGALSEGEVPIEQANAELAERLEHRVKVEAELATARKSLENIDFELRELEDQRGEAEQAVQDVRAELETVRIGWQETKVRRQTLEEQVKEDHFELQELTSNMPEGAEQESWAENLATLERKIQRLGPINLAAIEEFEQQTERKQYLDTQNDDLTEALTTLENAIRKIDKETRTRFKETYDQVNSGLQKLFPRLFGGGHAYLDLTGDDLLDAGVTVMARPPGKRNSTIHLLSGGEKALTAVALVFSIFELNPAPFCMLDEVDAPLDDANVNRYSDMLKEMAGKTQFIFITHNKLTMEIAHQLNGVTMSEPGVSHLVAVDVDQAVELAAV